MMVIFLTILKFYVTLYVVISNTNILFVSIKTWRGKTKNCNIYILLYSSSFEEEREGKQDR